MNKKFLISSLFIYFSILFLIPVLSGEINLAIIIFIILYALAVIINICIKNSLIALLFSLLLLAPMIILPEYVLLFAVGAFFITEQYIFIEKKNDQSAKKSNKKAERNNSQKIVLLFAPVGVTMQIIITAITFIRNRNMLQDNDNVFLLKSIQPIFLLVLVYFISHTILLLRKNNTAPAKTKQNDTGSLYCTGLKITACCSIISCCCSFIFFLLVCENNASVQYSCFFPCIIHAGMHVYYRDNVFMLIADSAEKVFIRLSEKRKT